MRWIKAKDGERGAGGTDDYVRTGLSTLVEENGIKEMLNCLPDTDAKTKDRPCIGSNKPDIPCYLKDKRGALAISHIIEVKGKRKEGAVKFEDAVLGQAVGFGGKLLEKYQVMRSSILCCVTDGRHFEFVLVKKDAEFTYQRSTIVVGADGWRCLLGFMCESDDSWYPRLDGFSFESVLGSGGSMIVYKAVEEKTLASVVVKFPKKEEMEKAIHREAAVLEDMGSNAGLSPYIPRLRSLEKTTSGLSVIVEEPVGVRVRPLRGGRSLSWKDFASLVDVLKFAHSDIKVLHRDIKPHNIFYSVGDKHAFLNDWSSAQYIGEEIPGVCTELWAPDDVLHGAAYRKKHDLICLVRSACACHTGSEPKEVGFWDRLSNDNSCWKSCLSTAEKEDYERLKDDLKYAMP